MTTTEMLLRLLKIQSNTFQEQALISFLKQTIEQQFPIKTCYESQDSLIYCFPTSPKKPFISLIGHVDVIPEYFDPYIEKDRIYGAGASDMKSSLASYLNLLIQHFEEIQKHCNLSLVLYSREEGTPLHQNGLYDLIQKFPDYFNTVELAIVGEPTANAIQIGCVGSIHVTVIVEGKACHSARPWEGKNALYEALPFIAQMAQIQPVKHSVFGVSFFDVIQITECSCEPGRTTLPGWWKANINFRFAPICTLAEAKEKLYCLLVTHGINPKNITFVDGVDAGSVIETELFSQSVRILDKPLEAKQAWTDVAQLTKLKIPAFNFGSGIPSQAHKKQEYASLELVEEYDRLLLKLLTQVG